MNRPSSYCVSWTEQEFVDVAREFRKLSYELKTVRKRGKYDHTEKHLTSTITALQDDSNGFFLSKIISSLPYKFKY